MCQVEALQEIRETVARTSMATTLIGFLVIELDRVGKLCSDIAQPLVNENLAEIIEKFTMLIMQLDGLIEYNKEQDREDEVLKKDIFKGFET